MAYYLGNEIIAEWGFEPQGFLGLPVPSANFQAFTYLKSVNINANENLSRDFSIDGNTGRSSTSTNKALHEVDVDMKFWLPDDLDSTALDVWLLKAGMDAFNVAHSGSAWVVPNTGTSVYPSIELPSFNLEIGHNKSGNLRIHHILGNIVDEFSVSVAEYEKVEFNLKSFAKRMYANQTSFTNGAASQSSGIPFAWEHCQVEFGDDNSTSVKTDISAINFGFKHNVKRVGGIGESSILVDALDATTGWVDSTDATSAATTTAFHEGAGAVSLAKDGVSSTACSMQKTISALDASNKIMYLWVYIADATTLTAIDVSSAANNHIKLGTGGVTNYNQYNMGTGLIAGWNLIRMDVNSPDTTGGSGADETLIDTVAIVFKADTSADTWTTDKVIVDHLRIFTPRSPASMTPQSFLISGSMKVNLTTASGMALFTDLADNSGDPIEMQDTANSKEILFRIRNLSNPSTQYLRWRLRDVQIGELPFDALPENLTEIDVPFTAQYYNFEIGTSDSSAPTNFNLQS